MTDVTPARIFEVATGFMAAKHLFVANEVGLFEKLAKGPATLDELTERIGIPRRTTRIVADAMVTLGFVERQGERYPNGPIAETFLSGAAPPIWAYSCATLIVSFTQRGCSSKRRCARAKPLAGPASLIVAETAGR